MKARGASLKKQENTFAGYFFAAPWIVGFLIFVVVPLGFFPLLEFHRLPGYIQGPCQLGGFENYTNLLFKDDSFRASIVNTLYLTVIGLPLQMGMALFLAVMLNQKMRGERIFRMAFYLPVILGFNTAVLLCWRLMLNTGTGIINQIDPFRLAWHFPPFGYLNRAMIFVQEITTAFFLGH